MTTLHEVAMAVDLGWMMGRWLGGFMAHVEHIDIVFHGVP